MESQCLCVCHCCERQKEQLIYIWELDVSPRGAALRPELCSFSCPVLDIQMSSCDAQPANRVSERGLGCRRGHFVPGLHG